MCTGHGTGAEIKVGFRYLVSGTLFFSLYQDRKETES